MSHLAAKLLKNFLLVVLTKLIISLLLLFGCRLNLLDVILPLDSVLRHYPLVDGPLTTPQHLQQLQATWTQHSIRALYWANLLLSLQQQMRAGAVDAGLSGRLSLSAEALAAPKHGTQVKVLFWSAATADLASLQIAEKGKVAALVPVSQRLKRGGENAI